jgi:hypothetical protein
MMKSFNYRFDIPGMTFEKELKILANIASLVPSNGNILEIGSAYGRSTHALYIGKSKSVSLTVVDLWGDPIPMPLGTYEGDPDLLEVLNKVSKEFNDFKFAFIECLGSSIIENINLVQASSSDFESVIDYDLVFLDGDHRYESVKIELDKFSDNKENLIIIDDFDTNNLEIVKAVMFERHNKFLIVPPYKQCKIAFLFPTTGYWVDKVDLIINLSK